MGKDDHVQGSTEEKNRMYVPHAHTTVTHPNFL